MKQLAFVIALCGGLFLRTAAIAQMPEISLEGRLYDTDHPVVNAFCVGVINYNGGYYVFGDIKNGKHGW